MKIPRSAFPIVRTAALLATLAGAPATQAANAALACTARAVETPAYTTDGMVEISSDSSQAEMDRDRIVFSGKVDLRQEARQLTADEVSYNQAEDTVDAAGNIVFTQPGLVLAGEEAHLDLRTDRARIQPLTYELPTIGGRGQASKGESEGNDTFHAEEVVFSTCKADDNGWQLTAKTLDVDRNTGIAEARNAKLRFKGVPIVASPWVQFPIDNRRLSGLLIPTFGYSSRNGIDFSLPYYFNLAPNYDAILTPRVISNRGLMLGGEFRYLLPGHKGDIYGEVINNDRLYEGDNDTRGGLRIEHNSSFTERFLGNLTYSTVSDDAYLEDFGTDLGTTSTRYLTNVAELIYHGDTWKALARWTQQDPLGGFDEPLTRLPQILYTTRQPIFGPAWLDLSAEYVNFERDSGPTAQRVDLYPALTYEWQKPWGYVRPRLSGRYTDYQVGDPLPGDSNNPSRNIYSASLDTGLFFETETQWLGSDAIQTLEPRLFYLYTPYRDQDEQPVYDSTIPDLSFPNLFRENRFTGADRVGDANQLSLGLTSRYIETHSLRERFHVGIGQILYFDDRKVQLVPGQAPDTASTSPLVTELDLTLNDKWSTRAIFQWNPEEDRAENSLLRLRYEGDREHHEIVNLAYRYDPTHDQEYSDLSFDWALSPRYRVVGRWQHSLSDDHLVEALGGLEYDSCCWRVRGAVRRYLATADGEYDNAIFLQLELKGLGRLGDNIDRVLNRALYDYRPLEQ